MDVVCTEVHDKLHQNYSHLPVELELILAAVAGLAAREGDCESGEERHLEVHVLLRLLQLLELRVARHHAVEPLLQTVEERESVPRSLVLSRLCTHLEYEHRVGEESPRERLVEGEASELLDGLLAERDALHDDVVGHHPVVQPLLLRVRVRRRPDISTFID